VFICECSDISCAQSLEIRPAECEAVRCERTRFVVVPGHQQTGLERVVGYARFLVVEKLAHTAAAVNSRSA